MIIFDFGLKRILSLQLVFCVQEGQITDGRRFEEANAGARVPETNEEVYNFIEIIFQL